MLRHRSFWVILVITALVSLSQLLADRSNYALQVRIAWEGVDTARYAVVYADTVLPLTVNSSGYQAIVRHFTVPDKQYRIRVHGDTTVTVGRLFIDAVVDELQLKDISSAESQVQSLRLHLTAREAKAFRPNLRGIDMQFDEHYGLMGETRIEPDSVWLYGSAESLGRITEIHTLPAHVEGLKDSCSLTIALDPTWRRYADLRTSTDSITLHVPVTHFTEKRISVPVQFRCEDDQVRARLYPDRVEVTLWVSDQEFDHLLPDMVQAEVRYDAALMPSMLDVRVASFPSYARVKSVSPSVLQYVIIKN